MMNFWWDINLVDDFVGLVYPKVCISCGVALLKHERYLCVECKYGLPHAEFHKDIEGSPIRKVLYGRVPVLGSAAYYLFSKKTGVQHILHHIKYKNGQELAREIGVWMANDLKNIEWIKDLEGLIPIPLHPRKQKERGYNQSEEFCRGLQMVLNMPVWNILTKNIYTSTQTKKRRYERWENVRDNFVVNDDISRFQHIALVDDVMTTGATIEAAYLALVRAGYKGKVSVIVIAMATQLI
ncbi:MAG: ComF family protein [Bacteroidetes bacterium]|nr:MAG: ComF family protein [Bacteroidota bacterium]